MRVLVVGLGLLGGSMALALRRCNFAEAYYGVDKDEAHATQALTMGMVDRIYKVDEAWPSADLIILATPIDSIQELLPTVLNRIETHTFVIDLGSTKHNICKTVKDHHNRAHYIATHPMAGTENSGPESAFAELFLNKVTVICDEQDSDKEGVRLIEKMYASLWMRVIKMSAQEHDKHIAYVSHLSHITSFVLGRSVLKIEEDEKNIFDMASTGFASTVRLAKSSAAMWTPIFADNQENILYALEVYIAELERFKKNIKENKFNEITAYIHQANEIRRILKGIES